MDQTLRRKWDDRHRARSDMPIPSRVLTENAHLLPASGRALDLACGLGSDALYLAVRGLEVWAWDISSVAIQRLRQRVSRRGLCIAARVQDVLAQPPSAGSFDVIIVSHFLDRTLTPALLAALRPEGLICYQTFTQRTPQAAPRGPQGPDRRLAENELLAMFVPPLRLRVYREENLCGDRSLGWRGMAMLVAQKMPEAS